VPIEGLISPGRSRRLPAPLPLFDDQLAGAETIVALLRAAEQDDQIAAVILFVNSSGGAALASDLIARAVRRLKRKKPVVAYLGSTAASGGYYVSALANCIVAQPLTITGSIGVVALRPYTREAFERVGVHRVALRRGQRAGLFSDAEPVDDEKRQVLADLVARLPGVQAGGGRGAFALGRGAGAYLWRGGCGRVPKRRRAAWWMRWGHLRLRLRRRAAWPACPSTARCGCMS
jgi:signal peptide peptidase SppA